MRRVDFVPYDLIYAPVRVLPVLAFCPPRAFSKTTLKSDARMRDVGCVIDAYRRNETSGPALSNGRIHR